jgi:predicted N-acetyltransferase YhbS
MEHFTIDHLKDHPEHLQTVAEWIYNEWWTQKPGVSVESMKERLREAQTGDSIPLSLVAFYEGHLAGTVNFIESDNSEFLNLKPWLAALLVHPKYRNRGLGSALVRECIVQARKLKYKEFYLGTDSPDFYEPLGAKKHALCSDGLHVMKVELD